MSQFGMQMPGSQFQRVASMNVYTGLLALGVLALLSACLVVAFVEGPKIGPDGSAFAIHSDPENIKLGGDK